MATAAEPAGVAMTDQPTLKDSVFARSQQADTDVVRDINASEAVAQEDSALEQVLSGPMLTAPTTEDVDAELERVLDVPFDKICHTGMAWNHKNFLIKIWRYTIVPIKEVYLPLMTWGLPTNFLMVSCCMLYKTIQNTLLHHCL